MAILKQLKRDAVFCVFMPIGLTFALIGAIARMLEWSFRLIADFCLIVTTRCLDLIADATDRKAP